jgi:DNA-binding transcriptional ArsR family regulator
MKKAKTENFLLKGGEEPIELKYQDLRKLVLVLRAINHDLRRQIVKLLSETAQMSVTDIYLKLRIEQSVASQHLAILRKAELVQTARNGKFIYYKINPVRLAQVDKLSLAIV